MRSASPWCGNVTITRRPLAHHARKLVLGLRETACRDRRARGLEGVRLRARKRVEARRPAEVGWVEPLLLPDPGDVVELPDEVGRRGQERRAVLRRILEESLVRDALCGRVDRRLVDRMQRTLGERREGAHVLDLVAEELDAERLATGAREDVDEPASHGDLAALLDPLDALVTRMGEPLDEAVEPSTELLVQVDRAGPFCLRRDAFGQRARRDADEPAPREDVERAGALADEVGGRLEARSRPHAATRKEGDTSGVGVPTDRLGDVACLLVLGEQAYERSVEACVERGEGEREQGLGDPRAGR